MDDELLARERLRHHLARHPDLEWVGEAASVAEAVSAFTCCRPDLLLLDIQLLDGTGFDVLERVGRVAVPLVVFITAHDDRAVQAFEARAVDYLLKPFTAERLDEALTRVRRWRGLEERGQFAASVGALIDSRPGHSSALHAHLVLRDREVVRIVPMAEIEWVRSARNYVEIHVAGRTHVERSTLGDLAARLDPAGFVRIHRTAIVARHLVREIRPGRTDAYEVVLATGVVLPMSRTYVTALKPDR